MGVCGIALHAQDISLQARPSPKLKRLWMWSLAALATGNIADVQSSWRAPEANPLLARSQGRFGWQSLGIKLGLQAPLVAFEVWQARKHPPPTLYKTDKGTTLAAGREFCAAARHT